MGVTEILYVDDENFDFVVDNTAAEVVISGAAIPNNTFGNFQNHLGATFLQEKDSFLVIGFGYRLPYCFPCSTDVGQFILQWFNPTAPQTNLIAELPPITLPENDRQFEFDQFVPWDPLLVAGNNVNLSIASFEFKISQIGAPAILNGTTQRLIPWMTIKHNFQMANV